MKGENVIIVYTMCVTYRGKCISHGLWCISVAIPTT